MNKKIENFLEILRPFFRKLVGWSEMEEYMNSMSYIIDNYMDISEFPKATGLLRQCQLADVELLRIVAQILDDHKLEYWLDHGTLLGAVRHKGFIPWDDDIDISMTRDQYDIAKNILPEELQKYGIYVTPPNPGRIGISIWKAGLLLDIFPMDNVSIDCVENFDALRKKTAAYRSFYMSHKNLDEKKLKVKKDEIIGVSASENPVWYHSVEFCGGKRIFENETIFPLQTIKFEEYEFYVPNDCHKYLTETYGDYMSFPKKGILHHQGGNGENGIIYNVVKYNTDIEAKIEELKKY